jgi:hypothetical protein
MKEVTSDTEPCEEQVCGVGDVCHFGVFAIPVDAAFGGALARIGRWTESLLDPQDITDGDEAEEIDG